ncbi:MAG TPA: EAL domain-containing protein, partial [Euzebya sp.]|nr:EAL domain-containing protein [Euzebya sp.]
ALAAAAFGFVLVRTVSGDWVLAGPLALIGLSIWLALRAQTGLLAEQDGLRRVASLGSVVLSPDLDENAAVGQLLATVADLLDATVVALRVTEPGGEQVVFTTDDRAHALLTDLATVGQPRVLALHECARGTVRDGLVVPLPADAPVTGTLLVADTVGASAVLGAVDLRVAISLAGQLTTMVHNARLNGTVRGQAHQARWEARHDSLTGLPNRLWMGEHLRRQPADRSYSILLLDLDGFKAVNDALGHSSGDDLLIDFAHRLRAIVPEDVIATRFAGDEFVCLVPGPVQRGMAVAVMACEHFQTASNIRGIRLSVTPSVGFAHHPTDGTDPEELLRAADVAMFRAKEDGSGVARFVVTDAEKAARKLRLGVDLREAINDERLTCVYQPVVSLRDGTVSHLEALARWQHPVLGPVSPEEFIALAEQGGLVRDLTLQVVRHAVRACGRWLAEGLDAGVAVNLYSQSLSDASMPADICTVLTEEGLAPHRFSVEITETTLLTDAGRALPLLAQFTAAGIGVAIDDFGTGYSSLAYLGRIPADVLKVDRSLVRNRDEARGGTILRAVIDLAASLGLKVIAEGIEDRGDYLWLRSIECELGQGYFIARPMPEEALADWCASWAITSHQLGLATPAYLSSTATR